MKRNFIVVAALAFVACGNSTKQGGEADSAAVATDSVAVVKDADVCAEDDKEFTTYDLACFELKGHVKKFVASENEWKTTYEFDRKGNLVKVSDENTDDFKIGRGPDGELTVESEYHVTRTFYALDNACLEDNVYRLAMMWGTDGGESYTANYEYDGEGKLVKVTTSVESPDEDAVVTENGVKVVKADEYGNWTARVVGNYGYTTYREIEYYK